MPRTGKQPATAAEVFTWTAITAQSTEPLLAEAMEHGAYGKDDQDLMRKVLHFPHIPYWMQEGARVQGTDVRTEDFEWSYSLVPMLLRNDTNTKRPIVPFLATRKQKDVARSQLVLAMTGQKLQRKTPDGTGASLLDEDTVGGGWDIRVFELSDKASFAALGSLQLVTPAEFTTRGVHPKVMEIIDLFNTSVAQSSLKACASLTPGDWSRRLFDAAASIKVVCLAGSVGRNLTTATELAQSLATVAGARQNRLSRGLQAYVVQRFGPEGSQERSGGAAGASASSTAMRRCRAKTTTRTPGATATETPTATSRALSTATTKSCTTRRATRTSARSRRSACSGAATTATPPSLCRSSLRTTRRRR